MVLKTLLAILSLLLVTVAAAIVYLVKYKRKKQHEVQLAQAEEAQLPGPRKTVPRTGKMPPSIKKHNQSTETQRVGEIIPQSVPPAARLQTQVTKTGEAESGATRKAEQAKEESQNQGVIKEELHPIVDETGQTALEQAQTRRLKRRGLEVVEEVQQVPKESQTTGLKELSPGARVRRRAPINRGGRPRSSPHHEQTSTQKVAHRRPKPEIVCWKRARQWLIGVEVPEELFASVQEIEISQNGSRLSQDDLEGNCWLLNSVSGQVVIRWNREENPLEINLSQVNYLLFKLSGQNLNQGRWVKSASWGSYLVVVPDMWERDETLAGHPHVSPESSALNGYLAHFFELEKGDKRRIAFRTHEGVSVSIPHTSARFDLIGEQLEDASDSVGPLFCKPPKIRAAAPQDWREIKTIVVGEEGGGRGKWRTQFTPNTDGTDQDMPSEILDRKGGWYFLRFYDGNEDLVESLDFRFLSGLYGIEIPETSPLPSGEGHKPIRVQLLHGPGITIQSLQDRSSLRITQEAGKTILTIPPNPKYDITRWLIGYENGPQVEVTILVERIWWGLGEDEIKPSQWEDKPLKLSQEDLKATSNKVIWLLLPRHRWIYNLLVGFEQEKAMSYDIRIVERTVRVPFRDFCDAEQVQHIGKFSLKFWLSRQQTTYIGTLGEMLVRAVCCECDFQAFSEEDLFHHVESSHLDVYFSPLTYEEIRSLYPSLPHRIYRCSYCNFYVSSDDPMNPTSAIIRHIEKECSNAPRTEGPPQTSFELIDDVGEIQQNVIENLPKMCKCRLCGSMMKENVSAMKQHLLGNHKNSLYTFC